jgi:hypothetical protein
MSDYTFTFSDNVPSGVTFGNSAKYFSLDWDSSGVFVTANPTLATIIGDYHLIITRSLTNHPEVSKNKIMRVTINPCETTLDFTTIDKTYIIGNPTATEWTINAPSQTPNC